MFVNEGLTVNSECFSYQQIKSKYVVFCEGYRLQDNSLFSGDFLNPSKGEVLILRIPDYKPSANVKRKFFLAPWKDDLFWFGAIDGWHFTDDKPSAKGFKILSDHAAKMIKIPFQIIDHLAAIRPTIKDRRPVIGRHPEYERIFLFNGLGTKGASLAPYWAEKLVSLIEDHQPLDPTVLYSRF
jgi:glycine/D-amino acid oxidase-like deaminating enzyme